MSIWQNKIYFKILLYNLNFTKKSIGTKYYNLVLTWGVDNFKPYSTNPPPYKETLPFLVGLGGRVGDEGANFGKWLIRVFGLDLIICICEQLIRDYEELMILD